MEWKYFFAISGYILTACDPVLGASTIINVTLVDGETPNEGRVEYLTSDDSTWKAACGDGLSSTETSVICRQLGYPGVSKLFNRWPFGTSFSLEHPKLSCGGDEGNLADCSLTTATSCDNAGGVICYESGYIGCYTTVLGELQTPCENGVQNLTTPKCVSSCHASTGSYTSAGLYQGNMCLCGKASTTIDQSTKEADRFCSSPCTGRTIETCGGDNHIALFNITLYLQNTKRTASSPGCAEPTPTQTEGAPTMTEGMPSTENVQTDSTSSVMTSDVTPTPRTPTRTTETGVQGNLGLYIGAGAGGGILLLIIIILLVVFIIRRRRSKEKGSSGDPNMELRSDLGDFPPLPLSPNNYSLENGHTNMAADDLTTGTGVEDSDDALIAETDMNQVNSARNGSTYGDVLRLGNTSGSHRPPQPAPRKSTKDTQFAMHPVHELYTTPDESQLSNGHRDSIPEYTVSQKFRKEPISQTVPQAPPSALGPEDTNGLYTMPDKSRNMTKAKKVLDSDMDRPAGIDNALNICRGEDGLQEGATPNEYATDKDGMGGEEEIDGNTGMVENELYETSYRPT